MAGPESTAQIGGAFELVDDQGRATSDLDHRGRHMLVSFGFSHCKSVCPRMLARTSAALDRLSLDPSGDLTTAIDALYVTVDPERDTPEVLRAFLSGRYPRFTGLTGDPLALQALRAKYRVFARRVEDPDDPDGYAVPHTAFTFLMGPDGRHLHHFSDAVSADEMAEILVRFLTRR